MAKKIKEEAVLIKKLIDKGYKPAYITNKFGFSKQKISYWKKNDIKYVQKRRKKLPEKYIKEIIRLAENQTTSNMGSRKIASIINKKLKEDGVNMTISRTTICKYLNEGLGKPRKIKKVFSTNRKKKKKELNFVKKSLI